MRRGLQFIVLIREDKKVEPFSDVITKAALYPQLFKDPECWSGRGLNLRPPAQQTGAQSHGANQAAVEESYLQQFLLRDRPKFLLLLKINRSDNNKTSLWKFNRSSEENS